MSEVKKDQSWREKYDAAVKQRDEIFRRYVNLLNAIKNEGVNMSARALAEQQEALRLFKPEAGP